MNPNQNGTDIGGTIYFKTDYAVYFTNKFEVSMCDDISWEIWLFFWNIFNFYIILKNIWTMLSRKLSL